MKILILCHFFPPTHTSGAENYTFNLARALIQHGHQVQVLCAGTWNRGKHYWNGFTDEVYEDVPVRRLRLCWQKAPDPNRYLYDNPIIAEHLRHWLRELQPDLIHITSCYTLSASVIAVCKETGIPLVVTLVDFWFLCPSLHLLRSNGVVCDGQTGAWDCLKCMLYRAKAYRWPAKLLPDSIIRPMLTAASKRPINRWRGLRGMALNMEERKRILAAMLRQADVILAPSRFLGAVHETIIKGLPIKVLPYGHDLKWLANYQDRSPDDQLHFCYMGQIAHNKGVHVLIEAFVKLDPGPNVKLDVWGDLPDGDPYIAHIRQMAARSGQIRLRGRFSRSQLGDVLSQADVVIVPSLWYENNPLVIQEAFAARIPVIATDLGGMSEFVQHEVNGLLFERGNADDLSRQMRRIIEEPVLLDQLRSAIPSVRTIEQEVDELVTIYQRLVRTIES